MIRLIKNILVVGGLLAVLSYVVPAHAQIASSDTTVLLSQQIGTGGGQLVNETATTITQAASKVASKLVAPTRTWLGMGLLIGIIWPMVGALLSPHSHHEISRAVAGFRQLGIMGVIAAGALVSPSAQWDVYNTYVVNPTMGEAIQIVNAIATDQSGACTSSIDFTAAVSGGTTPYGDFFACLTKNLSPGFDVASALFEGANSVGSNIPTSASGISSAAGLISANISADLAKLDYVISAIALMIANAAIIIVLMLELLSIVISIGMIGCFSPLLFLALPFQIMRPTGISVVRHFAHAAVTFVVWGIDGVIGSQIMTNTTASSIPTQMQLAQAAAPTGAWIAALTPFTVVGGKFWITIMLCAFLAWLFAQANSIASILVPGAASLGATGAAKAMSMASNTAQNTASVVSFLMKPFPSPQPQHAPGGGTPTGGRSMGGGGGPPSGIGG